MFTKDGNSSEKRARTGDTTRGSSRAGEGGGDDRTQLRAHGYEVISDVIVDASGDEWMTLFKVSATSFYSFAVLVLDPRDGVIFSLCIDPTYLGAMFIKPDNLVLNENFNLKIIDFDIAMRVEDRRSMTSAGR